MSGLTFARRSFRKVDILKLGLAQINQIPTTQQLALGAMGIDGYSIAAIEILDSCATLITYDTGMVAADKS